MSEDDRDRAAHRRDELAARFGENIARCRGRIRMSQEELAKRTELHRTEISLLERGRRGGRVDTLLRLAGAMELPPADLLEGMEWVPMEHEGGEFWVRDGARTAPATTSRPESGGRESER